MQYVQIYPYTNALWDTKMILAPFGLWMIVNFWKGDIFPEEDLENTTPPQAKICSTGPTIHHIPHYIQMFWK